MKNIEIDELSFGDIYCPRCGSLIFDEKKAVLADNLCKHVIFIAHDEGFEYSKKENLIKDFNNQDDHSVDEFLENQQMDDVLMISSYAPAPNTFGSYIGLDLTL